MAESEVAAVSLDADAAVVTGARIETRELMTCMNDPALITAAESITQAFLASEPEWKPNPPVKRPRTNRQRCGCALGGTCHVCNKCLEKHCTCGDRKRHRSMCLESRACNCLVLDPADRCALCHGCRRKQEYSHCRCRQHEQQRLRRAQATVQDGAAVRGEKNNEDAPCRCFALSTDVIPPTRKGGVSDRSMRIRRLRRSIGIPSVENLYQKKIKNGALSDENEDAVIEEEDDDDAALSCEGVESVLHGPLAQHLFRVDAAPRPYQSLHLGAGTTLLESIEPKDGDHYQRVKGVSRALLSLLLLACYVKD